MRAAGAGPGSGAPARVFTACAHQGTQGAHAPPPRACRGQVGQRNRRAARAHMYAPAAPPSTLPPAAGALQAFAAKSGSYLPRTACHWEGARRHSRAELSRTRAPLNLRTAPRRPAGPARRAGTANAASHGTDDAQQRLASPCLGGRCGATRCCRERKPRCAHAAADGWRPGGGRWRAPRRSCGVHSRTAWAQGAASARRRWSQQPKRKGARTCAPAPGPAR